MFKKAYNSKIIFIAISLTLLLNSICFALRLPIDPETTGERFNKLKVQTTFRKIDLFNEYELRIANVVDQIGMEPEDDVLIVGLGGMFWLPIACAVRAKKVDIVQPDKDEEFNQHEYLIDKFNAMRKFKHKKLLGNFIDKIDTESYKGEKF